MRRVRFVFGYQQAQLAGFDRVGVVEKPHSCFGLRPRFLNMLLTWLWRVGAQLTVEFYLLQ